MIAEVIFALCNKLIDGSLSHIEHEKSIKAFKYYLGFVSLSPNDNAVLLDRAVEICEGYGCSRLSDELYIAIAEELAKNYDTEIVTFDKGFINQAAKNAAAVKINLLTV